MTLRVAVLQMSSGRDAHANRAQFDDLVERAVGDGARYVQSPEYTTYYGPSSGFAEAAEDLDGPFLRHVAELARAHRVTIHVGSLLTPGGGGLFRNTSVVISPAGERVAVYHKVHLFDVAAPGIEFNESARIEPGTQRVSAPLGEFHLGLAVCFDVRFPELFRSLALDGVTVQALPAAFSAATGPAHWEVLVRSRAIENQVYVVAAAQCSTSAGPATYGHSLIVDPWGQILAEGSASEPGVIVADVDVSEVARRRSQIDSLGLRRPDAYETDS
ncbi:MAG: carbon-nitrogen hydrolase family protein [Acidimicrobiaceae bacterium]|nr:carbon-nitrogen hydrolase family protein [Acidimicrobiaceae bacterium]